MIRVYTLTEHYCRGVAVEGRYAFLRIPWADQETGVSVDNWLRLMAIANYSVKGKWG